MFYDLYLLAQNRLLILTRYEQITSIDEGSYTLQENNSNANNTDQSLSKIVEQIEDKFNKSWYLMLVL